MEEVNLGQELDSVRVAITEAELNIESVFDYAVARKLSDVADIAARAKDAISELSDAVQGL